MVLLALLSISHRLVSSKRSRFEVLADASTVSTAYSDRSALWVFQNYGYTANSLPPWDPSITPLIDNLNLAITNPEPDGNFTAYINYVDPDLSPPDAAVLYYGAATYDRLLGIKRSVDPGSVFWNPQAVGNAPPE